MDKEFLHFEKINRETWQNLHRKTTPPLSQTELNSIKSFNDRINLQDVRDVYLPLTNLIGIYKRSKEDLAFSKGIFLQKTSERQPFIIGVSGSVAVGKSTTSRLTSNPAVANLRRLDSRIGDNRWLPLSKCYLKRTRDPQSKRISRKL